MAEYAYQKHTPRIRNGASWDKYSPHIWNGSAWVEHPAMIYSEKTNQYLFANGNQYEDVTGGWYIHKSSNNPELIIADSKMYCSTSHEGDYGINLYVRTTNIIDLTNYNLLSVMVEDVNESFDVSIVDSDGSIKASSTTIEDYITTSGTIILDLSAIDGSYYVQLHSHSFDHGNDQDGHYANTSFTITEINLT